MRDADIADESSRLVRLNMLQQAAASILAQANQQPTMALQLLGS
jgi:flagellin